MSSETVLDRIESWPKLSELPAPAKALVTAIILTISVAMAGALGQIVIHDIIPTFFSGTHTGGQTEAHTADELQPPAEKKGNSDSDRGDLFAESPIKKESTDKPDFHKTEQFVWTLKWTHIHLFGMNMIFIFMGLITIFLDLSARRRTWLVVLPFFGVLLDIAAVWLKGYISPAFFWLHIPGGGLFGAIFTYVSIKALWEMWGSHLTSHSSDANSFSGKRS